MLALTTRAASFTRVGVVTEAHALELFREAVYDLVERRTPENVRRCLAASRLLDRTREEIKPTGSSKAPRALARR
jgi:hypothetical protein